MRWLGGLPIHLQQGDVIDNRLNVPILLLRTYFINNKVPVTLPSFTTPYVIN
jgi:hypothetical protein